MSGDPMGETKSTPGPWRVGPYEGHVESESGQLIAACCGYTRNYNADSLHQEQFANAHLIAAAPELLAACIEFVRKVECGEARSKRSYAQMKAAIAKSEGREAPR